LHSFATEALFRLLMIVASFPESHNGWHSGLAFAAGRSSPSIARDEHMGVEPAPKVFWLPHIKPGPVSGLLWESNTFKALTNSEGSRIRERFLHGSGGLK
jgi:hypothetical protein